MCDYIVFYYIVCDYIANIDILSFERNTSPLGSTTIQLYNYFEGNIQLSNLIDKIRDWDAGGKSIPLSRMNGSCLVA